MSELRLQLYNRGDAIPRKVVTLPLRTLELSLRLLPTELREVLKEEEIDLASCGDLFKERGLDGTLIEIETASRRLVMSVYTGEQDSRRASRTIKQGSEG